ncbi:ATP-binding protein [Actinomycetospora straminea]|uniref:Sensor histidine kinase n=1 Tax=Actinomycetospora straminea TaxID=663607 RepID=A0ABP9EFH8_9PSEU|nr:ATP-binding protein [Actinomycetospora straminea]MDD7934369.1 ATP-binding protein [Actinomycetospora straminea]
MTPKRSAPPTEAPDPFRHVGVVYRDDEELIATLAPLLDAARVRGDAVWVADDRVRTLVQDYLGADDGVVADDPARPYSWSGQTTASRRAEGLRALAEDDRGALLVGDRTTAGSADAWSVVDASTNIAMAGLPATVVCLSDAATTSDDADRYLAWNHAEVFTGAATTPNTRYRTPQDVLASVPAPPAPALGPADLATTFAGVAALREVRRAAKAQAREAGLDEEQVEGCVMAVGELASNSIEHGPGSGTVSWWTRPGRVVAQIDDIGHMSTTTPGLRRPEVRSVRGRGVWLARQLSDVLHLWTGADGTHVRVELGN